jgi:hypothetical protein
MSLRKSQSLTNLTSLDKFRMSLGLSLKSESISLDLETSTKESWYQSLQQDRGTPIPSLGLETPNLVSLIPGLYWDKINHVI